mmetsp:Transcript_70978/g.129940  ORF Transcript_70978/g.129940 Transcript_70978/m.129940 type:complete len:538 (-) Transcript_70978:71-1684(-)
MADIEHYVGIWTCPDRIRQFEVQSTGIVKFLKAARDLSSFRCGKATINQSRGCLQFTLQFRPDKVNPTGRAMWFVHLDKNVEQAFDVPMLPHPSLRSDGMSTNPVKYTFTGGLTTLPLKVDRTWRWYASDLERLPGLIAMDPQTLQRLCEQVPIPCVYSVKHGADGYASWRYIEWYEHEFICAVCQGVSKQITWTEHQRGKALSPLQALQGGTGVCLEFANAVASVVQAHYKKAQALVPAADRCSAIVMCGPTCAPPGDPYYYEELYRGCDTPIRASDVAVVIGLMDAKRPESVHAWVRFGDMHFEPQGGALITEHKKNYVIWYEYTCEEYRNCGNVSDSKVRALVERFVMDGGGLTNQQVLTKPVAPKSFSLCFEPAPGYYKHVAVKHRVLLMSLLNVPDEAINHIGSTAVPGMLGTPVVDLVLSLPKRLTSGQRRALMRNGYSCCGIAPHTVHEAEPHQWFNFSNDKDDEVVLHVVQCGDKWAEAADDMVYLLRRSEKDREKYQKAKKVAMHAANGSMSAYKHFKQPVTLEVLET